MIKPVERKTVAIGLRLIIEEIMRDIMFDIPSNPDIEKCTITKETILENKKPDLIIAKKQEEKKVKAKKQKKSYNVIKM